MAGRGKITSTANWEEGLGQLKGYPRLQTRTLCGHPLRSGHKGKVRCQHMVASIRERNHLESFPGDSDGKESA